MQRGREEGRRGGGGGGSHRVLPLCQLVLSLLNLLLCCLQLISLAFGSFLPRRDSQRSFYHLLLLTFKLLEAPPKLQSAGR